MNLQLLIGLMNSIYHTNTTIGDLPVEIKDRILELLTWWGHHRDSTDFLEDEEEF